MLNDTLPMHRHSNKSELDLVTDGDHDVRTDNPHGVTAEQLELSQYLLANGSQALTGDWNAGTSITGSALSSDSFICFSGGNCITGFTTDGTLSENSDSAVPTVSAVITYVANNAPTEAVTYNNSDTTITLTELGIILVIENSSDVVVNLPSVDSDNVGETLEVYRTGAGSVTINTADSDTINDSDTSIVASRAGQTDASIRLRLIRPTRYGIVSVVGSWSTS